MGVSVVVGVVSNCFHSWCVVVVEFNYYLRIIDTGIHNHN